MPTVVIRPGRAALLVILLSVSPAAAQSPSGRPLRTETPVTLAFGEQALELGADYQAGVRVTPLLGLGVTGDILRAPVVRYRVGFGRAEVSVGGVLQQFFSPDSPFPGPDSGSRNEYGDAELFVKVQALEQGPVRPSLGIMFGTKLPNAGDETALGTDEADFFLAFLLGRDWAKNELRFNVGMAILGDPQKLSDQEDLLTWGLGGRHGQAHAFTWEVWGSSLSDDARNLDEARARVGYEFELPRWVLDVSLYHGLDAASGDLGATIGVTLRFGEERVH